MTEQRHAGQPAWRFCCFGSAGNYPPDPAVCIMPPSFGGMMAGNYYKNLQSTIDRLDTLRGAALLEAIRQIIELALTEDDRDTVAEFSAHLIEEASYQGRLDLEMIGFGHMRNLYERDERYRDLRTQVLWYYKWLAQRLPEYVEVPRAQVEAFLDRMEAFFRQENEGLRPVFAARCIAASFMGLTDVAERNYQLWQQTPSHDSDDCAACETDGRVQYFLEMARPHEAIAAAEPIINGEESCSEVPARTFSRIMLPLLSQAKAEMAFAMWLLVRQQVRNTPSLLGHMAEQLNFIALVGAPWMVRRMLVLMLQRAADATNPHTLFLCWRGAWLALARLSRNDERTISWPNRPAFADLSDQTAAAAAHFQQKATELAAAFDARHGTDRFAKRVASTVALAEL